MRSPKPSKSFKCFQFFMNISRFKCKYFPLFEHKLILDTQILGTISPSCCSARCWSPPLLLLFKGLIKKSTRVSIKLPRPSGHSAREIFPAWGTVFHNFHLMVIYKDVCILFINWFIFNFINTSVRVCKKHWRSNQGEKSSTVLQYTQLTGRVPSSSGVSVNWNRTTWTKIAFWHCPDSDNSLRSFH